MQNDARIREILQRLTEMDALATSFKDATIEDIATGKNTAFPGFTNKGPVADLTNKRKPVLDVRQLEPNDDGIDTYTFGRDAINDNGNDGDNEDDNNNKDNEQQRAPMTKAAKKIFNVIQQRPQQTQQQGVVVVSVDDNEDEGEEESENEEDEDNNDDDDERDRANKKRRVE